MQETNVTHGESETGVHLEGEWELTGWKRRKGGRQPEAGEHTCAWGMPIGPVWQGQRDGPWPKQGWQANELGQWEVPWSF